MNLRLLSGRLLGLALEGLPRPLGRRAARPPAPRMLTYIVTFACNARCVMCDSWRLPSRDDLRPDELESILRQLPPLDVVRLSGGEPFLRKDLGELADLVQRVTRPLVLHITTNGFLTERIVRFCEARRRDVPLQLLVSIDAHGAEHDRIRGVPGSYERALETLRALAPQRERLRLSLAVNQTVVDGAGVADYPRLRDELAPLGIAHQVVLAYEESATYSLQRDREMAPAAPGAFTSFGVFRAGELEGLLDEIARDLRRLAPLERLAKRYYLDGLRARLVEGRGNPNPRCTALRRHLRLYPNGDVPTCQFSSRIVGNLRESSFAELWNSAAAERQRRWVDACAGCWAECEVLPSAIYGGDLLRHSIRRVLPRGLSVRGEPQHPVRP